MKRALPIVLIAVVLSATVLSVWYLKRSTAETPRANAARSTGPTQPTGAVKLGADPPHALGDTEAPVMIEEFADFQCQACGLVNTALQTMKQEFGARLVIVFREFPLETAHANALPAARAAEAAGLQRKFWDMHRLLFENQAAWRDATDAGPIFVEYANRIGLDLDQFQRDLGSAIVEKRISLDRERGRWIGVTATPTLFLNGREVSADFQSADKLRALIKAQP